MPHFTDQLARSTRRSRNFDPQIIGQRCTIRTTATNHESKVYVTIDTDPDPRERRRVDWKPRVSETGTLTRVYPVQGEKGVIIETDTGRPVLWW